MTETHPDFVLYLNSSWQFDAALHDADGNALNLAGAQIAWRLYDPLGKVELQLGVGSGITIIDAVGGLCQIVVQPQQNAVIPPGSYRDEIVVSLPNGFVTTQAVGKLMLQKPGTAPPTPAEDPCTALATLRSARLSLLAGQRTTSITIEGFTVAYSATDMPALERAIAQYDEACRKASGASPRRFAIGSGARSRTY